MSSSNTTLVSDEGMGKILCCNGKMFDLVSPKPEDIDINVIAQCLSKNDRASGNYSIRWSIADHSILVSYLAEYYASRSPFGEPFTSEQIRLCSLGGLMHDGSEAYLVDLPRPVKYMDGFQRYRELEFGVQQCVNKAAGCEDGSFDYRVVKKADDEALKFEFWFWLNGARTLEWLKDGYDSKAMEWVMSSNWYKRVEQYRVLCGNTWESSAVEFTGRFLELT